MTVKRFDVVDFLKGFSITTIVLMHLLQNFNGGGNPLIHKALSFGGAGVHVFILCSGFGLYLSYLNRPLSYGQFLKRRFFKVYIPYIIVVLLSAAIPFYNTSPEKGMALLSHLFFFKMFVERFENSFGIQMWFVSTIFQFYLLWPLIVKAFECLNKKGRSVPVVVSLIMGLCWATWVAWLGKEDMRVWGSFFLQYLWEFVAGMALALIYKKNPSSLKVPSVFVLAVVGIPMLAVTGYAGMKGGFLKMYNDVPSLLAYLSVALLAYRLAALRHFFSFTSKFSYEWYLVHILVFVCVFRLLGHTTLHLAVVLSFACIASYGTAWLYGRILDRCGLK